MPYLLVGALALAAAMQPGDWLRGTLCMHGRHDAVRLHRDGAARSAAPLSHPLISETANNPLNSRASDTAVAKRSMSGASLCSGMLGINS